MFPSRGRISRPARSHGQRRIRRGRARPVLFPILARHHAEPPRVRARRAGDPMRSAAPRGRIGRTIGPSAESASPTAHPVGDGDSGAGGSCAYVQPSARILPASAPGRLRCPRSRAAGADRRRDRADRPRPAPPARRARPPSAGALDGRARVGDRAARVAVVTGIAAAGRGRTHGAAAGALRRARAGRPSRARPPAPAAPSRSPGGRSRAGELALRVASPALATRAAATAREPARARPPSGDALGLSPGRRDLVRPGLLRPPHGLRRDADAARSSASPTARCRAARRSR